jgi:hypothetical protein
MPISTANEAVGEKAGKADPRQIGAGINARTKSSTKKSHLPRREAMVRHRLRVWAWRAAVTPRGLRT